MATYLSTKYSQLNEEAEPRILPVQIHLEGKWVAEGYDLLRLHVHIGITGDSSWL